MAGTNISSLITAEDMKLAGAIMGTDSASIVNIVQQVSGNATRIEGTAMSDSSGGYVSVDMGGETISGTGSQYVTIPTSVSVSEGDTVIISVANNKPVVIAAVGWGDNLNQAVLKLGDVVAASVTTDKLTAAQAYIKKLEANEETVKKLQAGTITVDDLVAADVEAGTLTAEEATIIKFYAESGSFDSLIAQVAKITDLEAVNARIDELDASKIGVDNLDAEVAKIVDLTAESATVEKLKAEFADVELANVNNAWIESGKIKDASITSTMIQDAAITDEKVLNLSANKLTAGTIDASKVRVTNIEADNITAGKLTVGGVTLDISNNKATVTGEAVEDGAISSEKLSQAVRDQIDGAVETWSVTEIPTLTNYPASSWEDDDVRKSHIGDVAYVINSTGDAHDGYCYRFGYDSTASEYVWTLVKDTDVTTALEKVTELDGTITEFKQEVSTFKTDTDSELSSLKTKTTELETSLGDKVDSVVFNEVKQTVDENSSSIKTLTETVSTSADTVSGLEQRVTNAETNITQNQNDITLAATNLSLVTQLQMAGAPSGSKFLTSSFSGTQAEWEDATAEGLEAQTWEVTNTAGVSVGDTVLISGTVTDVPEVDTGGTQTTDEDSGTVTESRMAFAIMEVTDLPETVVSVTGTMHGYIMPTTLDTLATNLRAEIQVEAGKIQNLVTDENGNSLMTQTPDGWTFNISSILSAVDDINSLGGWLRIGATDLNSGQTGLIIGKGTGEDGALNDGDITLQLINNKLAFMQVGQTEPVAYITDQLFHIRSGVLTEELHLGEQDETSGSWIWKKRANNHLGLRYLAPSS